jgi:hypothetical protein
LIANHHNEITLRLDLAAASWSWAPSLAGWAAPVQNTLVAAAADLGVNPLAGFSITFWTELIGAPGYWASIVQMEQPGTNGRYPGLWFSATGQLYVTYTTSTGIPEFYSSVLSGSYYQRMLVGVCFGPSGVTMRFKGEGGFSLNETRTSTSGNMVAFPSGAQLYVSNAWK